MQIFKVTKTGRGFAMKTFPKHRAFHKTNTKSGGALLLDQHTIFKDPSVTYGGQLPISKEKPFMEALQKDLEKLQPKTTKQRKNIKLVV
jgi:hypothetical protein